MDSETNSTVQPLGQVSLTLSGSVKSDCWSDYPEKWKFGQKTHFDVVDAEHFGWCIGAHVVALGMTLAASGDYVPRESEAVEGLAKYLESWLRDRRHEMEATDGR